MPEKHVKNKPTTPREKPERQALVLQFLIALEETNPLVWRRIEVPEKYSFWDLHVAIQDSMGWQDYHLHEFRVFHPKKKKLDFIGIPDDEIPNRPTLAGWQVKIADYFNHEAMIHSPPALYVYDFGDDWRHVITLESFSTPDPGNTYPRCVAGAQACPPEDCGGPHGFAEFLEAIADSAHPEHHDMKVWSGGEYDSDKFNPEAVSFDDSRVRWKKAFQE